MVFVARLPDFNGIIQINGIGIWFFGSPYPHSVNSENLLIPSKIMLRVATISLFLLSPAAHADTQKFADGGTVTGEVFGKYEGKPVRLYTLTNTNGVSVSITDYGA